MADALDESGLGLGERLRSTRKARALTLEQVAQDLHLDEAVLLALEEERFESLGAPIFVRGHLRNYARVLGLPEDVVLRAYRAADPASDALPRMTRDREKPLSSGPGPIGIAIIVLALLAGLVLVYFLDAGSRPAVPPPPAVTEVESAPPAALPAPAAPSDVAAPEAVAPPADAPAGNASSPPASDPPAPEAPVTAPAPTSAPAPEAPE